MLWKSANQAKKVVTNDAAATRRRFALDAYLKLPRTRSAAANAGNIQTLRTQEAFLWAIAFRRTMIRLARRIIHTVIRMPGIASAVIIGDPHRSENQGRDSSSSSSSCQCTFPDSNKSAPHCSPNPTTGSPARDPLSVLKE